MSENQTIIKEILDKKRKLRFYEKPKPKWLKKDSNCKGWEKYE